MTKIDIDTIIKNNRLYEILYLDLLQKNDINQDVLKKLKSYIDSYINYKNLNAEEVIENYDHYVKAYINDVNNFLKNSKYPIEINPVQREISRMEYDIFLIMSTVLTYHRYRIMENITNQGGGESAIFIGFGSGLEIELTKDKFKKIYAYDLIINDFCCHMHPEVNFRQSPFTDSENIKYGNIYLIEFLEHIKNPYEFLQICINTLNPNGQIILTTATDVPQFDHLYNFESDHNEFEKRIKNMGLNVIYKEDIPHKYLLSKLKAKNTFYILEK